MSLDLIWAYVQARPVLLIFGWLMLLTSVPLTFAAVFAEPPKRPSFTLDWRQRAALAWSGPAVLAASLALNLGRYPGAAILVAYISLWVTAPDWLRRHLGERADRKTIDRLFLGIQALIAIVCFGLVLFFQAQDFKAWRIQQDTARRERAMNQRFAAYAGFPDTTAYASARILMAENQERVPDVGRSYFDSPCDLLRFDSRNWFLCYGPDRRIISITVASKVLGGNGLAAAARDDARLLLWVVTGKDRPAEADRLVKALDSRTDRRPFAIGDITVEGAPANDLSFRTSAWRTGATLPDTSMISTYTY